MAWLRSSDSAAMHPVVLAPLVWPEPWPDRPDNTDAANLLYGLVLRCASHSAGYLTDYVVADGTVASMGGPNWRHWAELAERAGYWTRTDGGYRIMEDAADFVHIRRRDEIEWERQRRRDTADPALTVPVRLRDGDGCRYCGVVVNWHDRRSARGGTYDHRVPGEPARTPDDLVVACQGCNGARSDRPDARALLPVPATPYYAPDTLAWLSRHGHAPGDPAPGGTTPTSADPGDPATSRNTPASTSTSADPADPRHAGSRSPGRERVGSGRGGKGRARRGRPGTIKQKDPEGQ